MDSIIDKVAIQNVIKQYTGVDDADEARNKLLSRGLFSKARESAEETRGQVASAVSKTVEDALASVAGLTNLTISKRTLPEDQETPQLDYFLGEDIEAQDQLVDKTGMFLKQAKESTQEIDKKDADEGTIISSDSGSAVEVQPDTDGKAPLDPNSFTQKHLKKVEASGYDTLFANAEKTSKQFKDVKITNMSIGDLIEFTEPSGAYGKWVKPRLPEDTEAYQKDLTSTPLGKYQIVGTTLRKLVKDYGWDLEDKFTKEVQDRMFLQLAHEALDNKETMAEKVKSMRSVWEGLREGKGSTEQDVIKMIKEIESSRLFESPRPRRKPAGVMERPPL